MATQVLVTRCCEVEPELMRGPDGPWRRCPRCLRGAYYSSVETKWNYIPDVYEKGIEDRIEALERKVRALEDRGN